MNKGQKATYRRKIPWIIKSYSLLLRVTMQIGEVEVDEDNEE
jgi:hypothetical protein